MDCVQAQRDELLESYVLNRLSENERDELEAHYFACDACLERVEALLLAREGLARQRETLEAEEKRRERPAGWLWLAAAALVLAAVGGGLWWRAQQASGALAGALAEIARVEPPTYAPVRLRGPVDEASVRFREAMEQYGRGDFAAAAAGLEAASEIRPEAPEIGFYLGASRLLVGDRRGGIRSLRGVVGLGDTPYLEEARWLLANAYLLQGDASSARAELRALVALEGELEAEARALSDRIDEVVRPED